MRGLSLPRHPIGGWLPARRLGTLLQVPAGAGPVGDERGATLALVGMALSGLVVILALVLDLGGGQLAQRQLEPATDAAALAAAQLLVTQPTNTTGACATAGSYLAANAPEATMVTCQVVPEPPTGGRVEVGASQTFQGSVLGGEETLTSTSGAAWGPPLTVAGLRPLALCYDGSPELRAVIDNPPSEPKEVKIWFPKLDPTACGGVAVVGNFLSVDFEGDGHLWSIRRWMRDGYKGEVALDPDPGAGCGAGSVCYQRPYALLDLIWETVGLVSSGAYATFPVYDYADADRVHLVGVVRARLLGFDLDGSLDGWWLKLKVRPGFVAGDCCGPGAIDGGNKAIALCDVGRGALPSCGFGSEP